MVWKGRWGPEGGVWGGSVGLLILVEEDLVALHHHAHAVPGPATQQPLYTPQISTSFSGSGSLLKMKEPVPQYGT